MKKKRLILPLKLLLIAVLIAAVALTFASCLREDNSNKGSDNNTTSDQVESESGQTKSENEYGEGKTTITVNVIVGDEKTALTVHTDAENLADALTENNIAEGSDSEYGLFITKMNGKEAEDGYWWCIMQNGEMLMTGASSTPISDGETFDFVYSQY